MLKDNYNRMSDSEISRRKEELRKSKEKMLKSRKKNRTARTNDVGRQVGSALSEKELNSMRTKGTY